MKAFGKRIGVQTSGISNKTHTKRSAIEFILANAPKDNAEQIISAFVQMAKFGDLDKDYSQEVVDGLNPTLEKTMSCKVDITAKLSPVFPLLKQEPDLVVKALNRLGFVKSSTFYEQAFKAYNISPKGTVGLLRSTIDTLADEILNTKGVTPLPSNFKDKLTKMEDLNILRRLDTVECVRCHYIKNDNEFNLSYDIFGILSYYGSHTD